MLQPLNCLNKIQLYCKTGAPQSTIWGTKYLLETAFAGWTGGTLWIKVLLQSHRCCQGFLSMSPFHALLSNQLVLQPHLLPGSFYSVKPIPFPCHEPLFALWDHLCCKEHQTGWKPHLLVFCKTITFPSKGQASYKPGHSPTWNSLALHLNKKIFSLLSITK